MKLLLLLQRETHGADVSQGLWVGIVWMWGWARATCGGSCVGVWHGGQTLGHTDVGTPTAFTYTHAHPHMRAHAPGTAWPSGAVQVHARLFRG